MVGGLHKLPARLGLGKLRLGGSFHAVLPGYAEDLAPTKRTVPLAILNELRAVARTWAPPLEEIARQYQQSALTIVLKTASSRELNDIYSRLEEQGKNATELYICMGITASWNPHRFTLRPSLRGVVEDVDIDWSHIFVCLPALKVLNLAEMPLESRHVLAALETVSTYCMKLESLTLPCGEKGGNEENVRMVLSKLYKALKRWRVEGNLGGLRRLTVPTRATGSEDPYHASGEFFENVMTNCPLVEYLDGYKVSLSAVEGLTCADTWLLDLRDWERFNATCTKLREFHWVVAPFGDPYFRVFGEYVKPQLKKLSFGVGIHWNWRWYFHDKSEAAGEINGDWDKQAFCARSGYGNLATDAKAALKGCPMLDELQIQLYHPNDIYPLFDSGDGVPLTRELVDHEMINAEVFGDPFCEALASYCHFLSHFSIVEVAEEFNTEDISPIQAFTDRGLMALSRLKYLQSLDLRSVNCSGEGVLGFLNSLSSDFTGNRTFEIRIGGIPHESRLKFYDVVKELLVKIAQASDLPCADRKFVLRLENVSYSSPYAVTRDYSASFFRELERLMTRVKAAHPSLRQHVVTMERNDTLFTRMNFMRVAEFGLYSVNADPRIYAEWEDWGGCLSSEGITMANREADDNEPSPVESRHMYCSGYDSYDGYDYYM